MKYNFDKLAKRRNTDSLKRDVTQINELPMWVADMDFECFPEITKELRKRVNIKSYGYSLIPNEFFECVEEWWKRNHDVTFEIEDMIYVSGVVATISSVVRRVTNVGDKVIVMPPVYNIFYNSILNNNRVVLKNELIEKKEGFCIDFDDLEVKMSDPKAKLLILCNPHNPTGNIWSINELKRIANLAKKYNVLVISDEIHCDIVDPGFKYNSFYAAGDSAKDVGIICLSASKAFNVAGLQSSVCIVHNKELKNFIERGLNNDEIAEPNFFSISANIIAFKKGDEYIKQLNEYIYRNKMYFYNYIEHNLPKLKVVKSHATYLVWVNIEYYSSNSSEFVKMLREKTGLFVNDGEEYGEAGKHYFRINLATSLKNVKDSLNRLKMFIEGFENK